METDFEYQRGRRRGRRFRLYFPLLMVAFFVIGGLAVMLLWNAILPDIFPTVGHVNYFQALGLLILSKILFGGFRGRPGGDRGFGREGFRGGPPPPWKQKMMEMTDEEREKFRSEWRERCRRK